MAISEKYFQGSRPEFQLRSRYNHPGFKRLLETGALENGRVEAEAETGDGNEEKVVENEGDDTRDRNTSGNSKDAIIKAIVQHSQKPFTSWKNIALLLPGWQRKQVRERWTNYLNPLLKKGPFSRKEVRLSANETYSASSLFVHLFSLVLTGLRRIGVSQKLMENWVPSGWLSVRNTFGERGQRID